MWKKKLPSLSLQGLKSFYSVCLDTGNSFLTNLISTSIVTANPLFLSLPRSLFVTEALGQFNSPSGAEIGPKRSVKVHPAFKRQQPSACHKSRSAVKKGESGIEIRN